MKGYKSIFLTEKRVTQRQKNIIFWGAVAAFFIFLAFTYFVTVPWLQTEIAHSKCISECRNPQGRINIDIENSTIIGKEEYSSCIKKC